MTTLTYFIPVLIFGITLIVVLGIIQYASYLKRHRDVLRKIEEEGHDKRETPNLTLKDRARQVFVRLTRGLGPLAKPKGEEEVSQLRRRLLHAGLGRFKNIVMMFYGSKVLLTILLPVLFAFFKFSVFTRMRPTMFMLLIVVLALAGFYLPEIWLKIRINSRKDQITRGFPDALDLMVICTEAGMGLDSTINRVGEEMKLRHPALSEELKILMLELRAGKLRRDALRNLAMRTDSEDVQSFVTLLIQTEKFGTNVAQAMRVQADSMRTRRAQKVEQLAATLAVKLLFPTILLIFPSLFLVLLGPALIRAFRLWKG
ncbi:MAG: type II secretion system F family protein [Syntrophorhabdaceae bacterium]|nr:type II secretion system F family protein [Syntrophorhabdaceae bacterium]MDD4196794.1 type II secretion system F family protein [Syntrophorhabdaceae bacterium]